MLESYPARYRDERGEEETHIENDGATLFLVLRGVRFSGPDFDWLEPEEGTPHEALESFTFDNGSIGAFVFEWTMPLQVLVDGVPQVATLLAKLALGQPRAQRGPDRQDLELALQLSDGQVCVSAPPNGWNGFFSNVLAAIEQQLPPNVRLRCCYSCAFSVYHAAGYRLFGDLACFRNHKAEARGVKMKQGFYWWLWEQGCAQQVQETYLCPEFEHRPPPRRTT